MANRNKSHTPKTAPTPSPSPNNKGGGLYTGFLSPPLYPREGLGVGAVFCGVRVFPFGEKTYLDDYIIHNSQFTIHNYFGRNPCLIQ